MRRPLIAAVFMLLASASAARAQLGACCFCDGTCHDLELEDCVIQSYGVWQGEGTSCVKVECAAFAAACCLPDGSCVDIASCSYVCLSIGGIEHPPGVFCSDVDCSCPADLDYDGNVGFADLILLLSRWGPCASTCPADVDATGDVGLSDLLAVLAAWGACG